LIIISGRNEELPGKPLVYSTSKSFMDYFGINSTDDLPKIKEVLAEQSIQGTLINDAINNHNDDAETATEENVTAPNEIEENGTTLIVADNGQLIEQALDPSLEESANAAEEAGTELLESEEPSDTNHDAEEISSNKDENDLPADAGSSEEEKRKDEHNTSDNKQNEEE
jgi:segregation and condensation protein B